MWWCRAMSRSFNFSRPGFGGTQQPAARTRNKEARTAAGKGHSAKMLPFEHAGEHARFPSRAVGGRGATESGVLCAQEGARRTKALVLYVTQFQFSKAPD